MCSPLQFLIMLYPFNIPLYICSSKKKEKHSQLVHRNAMRLLIFLRCFQIKFQSFVTSDCPKISMSNPSDEDNNKLVNLPANNTRMPTKLSLFMRAISRRAYDDIRFLKNPAMYVLGHNRKIPPSPSDYTAVVSVTGHQVIC